jgi:hypothetical protein
MVRNTCHRMYLHGAVEGKVALNHLCAHHCRAKRKRNTVLVTRVPNDVILAEPAWSVAAELRPAVDLPMRSG